MHFHYSIFGLALLPLILILVLFITDSTLSSYRLRITCGDHCSICAVLYVLTVRACVCVSRVACVCVLGLDDSHRFMNGLWSMLVRTLCLHIVHYVSACKCDCVYFSVNVCVDLLWPMMCFLFLKKKKRGGERKAVPWPGSPLPRWPGIPGALGLTWRTF